MNQHDLDLWSLILPGLIAIYTINYDVHGKTLVNYIGMEKHMPKVNVSYPFRRKHTNQHYKLIFGDLSEQLIIQTHLRHLHIVCTRSRICANCLALVTCVTPDTRPSMNATFCSQQSHTAESPPMYHNISMDFTPGASDYRESCWCDFTLLISLPLLRPCGAAPCPARPLSWACGGSALPSSSMLSSSVGHTQYAMLTCIQLNITSLLSI